MTEYTLTRSKRKTAVIYIRDGGVDVRAPLKMPKRDIDRFVASKEKWITDKLASLNERTTLRGSFSLDYGDSIVYRGVQCPVAAIAGNRAGFDDGRFYIPPDLTIGQIKAACVQVYRMLAKHYLTERTLFFAKQMSVIPSAVNINGAKTRWGSCSAKKSINFSWRLIMADDGVIDYVVVHELAHLTEMNHGAEFWRIVESVLPDYRERKARLRELQKRLAVEDWESTQ